MSHTLVFLSLALLALAAPAPRKRSGMSIPLSKSFKLSTSDGVIDLSGLRTHAAYISTKYSDGDKRRRQEGTLDLTDYRDLLWYGPITVGSTNQQFLIDFDTGSSDLFIAGTTCPECKKHSVYDPQTSTASAPTGETFLLKYGDGSQASGEIFLDTVTVAGISATAQAVGAAMYENGSFTTDICDGLMGMGYPALSSYERLPFFNSLMEQHAVAEGAFAFKLDAVESSLYLGGTDAPFIGSEISWSPVTRPLYWQVMMDAVTVDGVSPLTNMSAIVDTGTTLIVGSPATVKAFYASIPGSAKVPASIAEGFYSFPCMNAPQEIFLTFNGVSWAMSPTDFNLGRLDTGSPLCVGAVYEQAKLPFWILGDVFLRGQATIFDFDHDRVGFAPLA